MARTVLARNLPGETDPIEAVVARFLKAAPAVTRFARTLAGNDELQVRLGPSASANDHEIVLDPALFQAAATRDAPVTPEEVALASALHEAVHLVATRLDDPRVPPWQPDADPMDLPTALTTREPVTEVLFFALEDARQEAQHLGAYPGARSVLADLYRAASLRAVDGTGPLGQFALLCFLETGGYPEPPLPLDPRARAAFTDAKDVLAGVAAADDPWNVASAAIDLVEIARRHRLLQPGDAKRAEAAAAAARTAVDRVRLDSPIVRNVQAHRETRQAAEARSGPEGKKGPAELAGEASTDQLLRVGQAPTVHLPTGQRGKLLVSRFPLRFRDHAAEGHEAMRHAADAWHVAQQHVAGELHPLFVANQRRGLKAGYDAGDLSPYAALLLGAGLYQRMYERRDLPTRRAYAVSLLIDGSASMLQGAPRAPWAMAAATLGAWTIARLCDELQVDFEVALFNRTFAARPDDTESSYVQRRRRTAGGLRQRRGGEADRLTNTVNHYLIKTFDEPWRAAEPSLAGLFWAAAEPARAAGRARRDPEQAPPVSLFAKAANVDEFNLVHAAQRMAKRRTNVRVLVVLSDGMTRGSTRALAAAAGEIERSGTTVLGIGIGDATVADTYTRYETAEQPHQLTSAMIEGVRGALRRSLALWGVDTWWNRAARPKETNRA